MAIIFCYFTLFFIILHFYLPKRVLYVEKNYLPKTHMRSGHQSFRLTPASKLYYPMVFTSIFLLSYSFHFSFVFTYCNDLSSFLSCSASLFLLYLITISFLSRFQLFLLFSYSFVLQNGLCFTFLVDRTSLSFVFLHLCEFVCLCLYYIM